MVDDEKIIDLFFRRSEQAIRELDTKYGKVCHVLSYNIVNDRQDAEECVNDAYLGAWNTIPPTKPNSLRAYICKIVRNVSLKLYYKNGTAKRSSAYEIAIPKTLVGGPQSLGLAALRPAEHGQRRGFLLPAVTGSCTA